MQLEGFGGSDVNDCVNTIMKQLMTTRLADEYSEYGLGGNKNFSVTFVHKIILGKLYRRLFAWKTLQL
jgi:hypothetical protein